jgi:hypothetical protein
MDNSCAFRKPKPSDHRRMCDASSWCFVISIARVGKFFQVMEWISQCVSLRSCLSTLLYHLTPNGNDWTLRCLAPWRFGFPRAWKLTLAVGFASGLWLRGMPCFKGFSCWSSLFLLIVEIYFHLFAIIYWQCSRHDLDWFRCQQTRHAPTITKYNDETRTRIDWGLLTRQNRNHLPVYWWVIGW